MGFCQLAVGIVHYTSSFSRGWQASPSYLASIGSGVCKRIPNSLKLHYNTCTRAATDNNNNNDIKREVLAVYLFASRISSWSVWIVAQTRLNTSPPPRELVCNVQKNTSDQHPIILFVLGPCCCGQAAACRRPTSGVVAVRMNMSALSVHQPQGPISRNWQNVRPRSV